MEAKYEAAMDAPKGTLHRCGGIGSFEGSCGAEDCVTCRGGNAVSQEVLDEDDEATQ